MTKQQINQEFAEVVMNQIGKMAFRMLGAKNFTYSSESPLFGFQVQGSTKFNHIRIEGDAFDTYKVTFTKIRGIEIKNQEVIEGVYADMLHKLIETKTGLLTSF